MKLKPLITALPVACLLLAGCAQTAGQVSSAPAPEASAQSEPAEPTAEVVEYEPWEDQEVSLVLYYSSLLQPESVAKELFSDWIMGPESHWQLEEDRVRNPHLLRAHLRR